MSQNWVKVGYHLFSIKTVLLQGPCTSNIVDQGKY